MPSVIHLHSYATVTTQSIRKCNQFVSIHNQKQVTDLFHAPQRLDQAIYVVSVTLNNQYRYFLEIDCIGGVFLSEAAEISL